MPFETPTLAQIIAGQESDLYLELQGEAPFPASDRLVLSRVVGGVAHGLYGFLAYKARQANPATADDETEMERHAAWWGVERKQATAARGTVIAPVGSAGTVVPAGMVLQTAEGVQVLLSASVELSADAPTEAAAFAVLPGVAGNLPGGAKLRLAETVTGVSGEWQVSPEGFALGTDIESLPRLKSRLADRVRQPPRGGALHDYRAWALAVPGVTRAWVRDNWVGRGTVGVMIVNDEAPGLEPGPALVAAVQAYLADPVRLPPGAEPFALAPTFRPVSFRIAGLSPATPEVRRAVKDSLQRLILAEAKPGGILLVSHMREAISTAAGEYDHALLSPSANIAHESHEMAVYGSVEWDE